MPADLADLGVGEAVPLGQAQQRRASARRRRSTSAATSLISSSWSTNHGSIAVASKISSGVAPARIASITLLEPAVVRAPDLLEQRVLVELDPLLAPVEDARSGSSSERSAFCSASVKLRPIAIASPTDFMCVVSVGSARRELLEREPRHLHHDVVERRLEARRRALPSRVVMSLGISSRV